jgi:hypothetical protein
MNLHRERIASPVLSILAGLVLLLLAGLLAACGSGPGTLRGRVVDAKGRAVPQLAVAVYELEGRGPLGQGSLYQKGSVVQEQSSGDDGRFSFVLEPGRYVVQVQQDGAVVGSRMVEIKANRTLTVEFQLAGSSRGVVYMAKMFSRGVSPWI